MSIIVIMPFFVAIMIIMMIMSVIIIMPIVMITIVLMPIPWSPGLPISGIISIMPSGMIYNISRQENISN